MYSQRRRNGRRRRRKARLEKLLFLTVEILILVVVVYVAKSVLIKKDPIEVAEEIEEKDEYPDWIDEEYLSVDNPSRTGERLDGINDIVVHYVGNPGTTAWQNWNYYNSSDSVVCSHFIVGLDGDIIQCLPLYEKSEASNDRNHDTISIEVCHPGEDGKFTEESYDSLVKLVQWLMKEFDLDSDHVIRHYDVTGKICPKYFVEHEDAWEQFKKDLDD